MLVRQRFRPLTPKCDLTKDNKILLVLKGIAWLASLAASFETGSCGGGLVPARI